MHALSANNTHMLIAARDAGVDRFPLLVFTPRTSRRRQMSCRLSKPARIPQCRRTDTAGKAVQRPDVPLLPGTRHDQPARRYCRVNRERRLRRRHLPEARKACEAIERQHAVSCDPRLGAVHRPGLWLQQTYEWIFQQVQFPQPKKRLHNFAPRPSLLKMSARCVSANGAIMARYHVCDLGLEEALATEQSIDEVTLGGVRLSLLAGDLLVRSVVADAVSGTVGYVCIANVHQVTEAWRNDKFRQTLARARWVSTDSRVLEATLAAFGRHYPSPVTYGVEILESICAAASESGIKVGLFGGSPSLEEDLVNALRKRFPLLRLATVHVPGYGSVEQLAGEPVINAINASEVKILLVGLGCPKQETWMQLVSDKTACVMVGVGAAFDFYAGHKTASPGWVRRAGFDWLWRLFSEPRRLWRRYILGNSRFLLRIVPALINRWLNRVTPGDSHHQSNGQLS